MIEFQIPPEVGTLQTSEILPIISDVGLFDTTGLSRQEFMELFQDCQEEFTSQYKNRGRRSTVTDMDSL
jgi:hypothetical protein